jgi:hypothetical protein
MPIPRDQRFLSRIDDVSQCVQFWLPPDQKEAPNTWAVGLPAAAQVGVFPHDSSLAHGATNRPNFLNHTERFLVHMRQNAAGEFHHAKD